jgi:hypothetical protein
MTAKAGTTATAMNSNGNDNSNGKVKDKCGGSSLRSE